MNRGAVLATLVVLLGACTSGAGTGLDGAGGESGDLPPQLQVLGKVVDGGGIPVPNAIISSSESVATSAPDGWFDLQTAAAGTVTVAKPGWVGTDIAWDGSSAFIEVAIEPIRIRGLRVGGGAAGDDAHFSLILALADETAVNALVFDTKQEGGGCSMTPRCRRHTSGEPW